MTFPRQGSKAVTAPCSQSTPTGGIASDRGAMTTSNPFGPMVASLVRAQLVTSSTHTRRLWSSYKSPPATSRQLPLPPLENTTVNLLMPVAKEFGSNVTRKFTSGARRDSGGEWFRRGVTIEDGERKAEGLQGQNSGIQHVPGGST